jgi:hypothetical protein
MSVAGRSSAITTMTLKVSSAHITPRSAIQRAIAVFCTRSLTAPVQALQKNAASTLHSNIAPTIGTKSTASTRGLARSRRPPPIAAGRLIGASSPQRAQSSEEHRSHSSASPIF